MKFQHERRSRIWYVEYSEDEDPPEWAEEIDVYYSADAIWFKGDGEEAWIRADESVYLESME